jgi:hypothetical protein
MIHHVFANTSNIGDWLSAQGIQSLLGADAGQGNLLEHYCDEPFLPATFRALSQAGAQDLVIIGGGGLFMDYFTPFWEGFLPVSARVPFCIWGVGFCDAKYRDSRPPSGLLETVVQRARFCSVRDDLSRHYLAACLVPAAVSCPSVCVLEPVAGQGGGLLYVDAYDNLGERSYQLTVSLLQEFAGVSGRRYRQVNHRIKAGSHTELQGMLDAYRESDLVVSSRLHGCIIALALGKKLLAISGDRKVESFMARAGLEQWVVDAANVQAIPGYLEGIGQQGSVQEFITRSRQENALLGRKVEHLLAGGRQLQSPPRGSVKL